MRVLLVLSISAAVLAFANGDEAKEAPEAARVLGFDDTLGSSDRVGDRSISLEEIAPVAGMNDRGPTDVVNDLHAKYQSSVNKAKVQLDKALKFASEALLEQESRPNDNREIRFDV